MANSRCRRLAKLVLGLALVLGHPPRALAQVGTWDLTGTAHVRYRESHTAIRLEVPLETTLVLRADRTYVAQIRQGFCTTAVGDPLTISGRWQLVGTPGSLQFGSVLRRVLRACYGE